MRKDKYYIMNSFYNDEQGAIVSIELVLIITIAVLALIVGWSEVAVAVNTELNDISNGVGSLNQSLFATCFGVGANGNGKFKSVYAGQWWDDFADDCDANTTCDLVGSGLVAGNG
ncbi:MAG: hypothetical protein JWN70_5434 [Planctomycetaceae bacterium]|nr:hypothetical protein [Planctomycetaceae bacterium]